MIPLEHILFFSAALFAVGIMGLFLQQSMLRIFLAVEAMLNGAAFGFVGIAVQSHQIDGHIMFLMVLAVAAAEVGVGLAILLIFDRLYQTLDITSVNSVKE